MNSSLPESAKVVIIGGGIVGCSTAYHLAHLGCEVVLLERHKLTSGTTFHAAGLVGQLRSNANITELLGYSVELYRRIEAETGLGSGWKMNGGLRLACNADRWTEVKRQASTAHAFGLDMQLLTPKEALDLWPLMTIEDLHGAAFLPTDGQANPADITQALAKGARMKGAIIKEDIDVLDLAFNQGKLSGIITTAGAIQCEKLVCCMGQWTREFAARVGVNVPLVSVQHQYLVTEAISGITNSLPTLRDPDRLTYFKEEVGGLVMGGYEPDPIAWAVDGIPENFNFSLLDENVQHFEPLMKQAIERVPALNDVGIKQLINGPESFTPDGNFILGEAPELDNFFVGAGFNAFGIAAGGGAGMALAEWVRHGEPPYDLWPVDIRRFGPSHQSVDWVRTRTLEAYAKHYTIAWPHEEFSSARPSRRSPLYELLKAQGACFGEKLGWERPNWFADASSGELPNDVYSFAKPGWFDAVAREHYAARHAAVLIDQSSFAKFILKGPDALVALEWLAANDVSKPVGSLVYSQLLDDKGGIQADVTIARLADDEFYIVTGTGFATRDFDWIRRNIPIGLNAQLVNVTSAYAVLSLMGPSSRYILSQLSRDDISNENFPFASCRKIDVAACPTLALRITYVGELGFELHIPIEFAVTLYSALLEAGREQGLINAGYRMIESCRLEKSYRAWGSDIGPDHTPIEAGLAWAVKYPRTDVIFKGREAVVRQLEQGIQKRLVCFTVNDPTCVLFGREIILHDGKPVGWLSSAGFGHHLELSIGMGYVRSIDGVDKDFILKGQYQLKVGDRLIDCSAQLTPPFDPDMKKIKR